MEPPRGPAEVSVTFFLLRRILAMTSHFELTAGEHGCENYRARRHAVCARHSWYE